MDNQSEVENLKQAIQALEAQRHALGEAVVESALAPLRKKLASLLTGGQGEQRKLVSVLFADLAGFTSLVARMDPEDVREVMNAYFARWSACIKRWEGVVEKYIGDAVLAVFGLPLSREDDPERAVRASLDMQKELIQFNNLVESQRGFRLSMRVGIHTGEVVVSLLGERQGEEFVVVGDTVNLASRLQAAAPEGEILITQDTYRHVGGLFVTNPLGPLQLKGFEQPVQAYRVLAARPRSFRPGGRGVEGVETAMVGRRVEFQQVESAFQQAREGKKTVLLTLVGEAGLGKSRLLYEFESWMALRQEPVDLFRARAHPSTEHLPYSLLRELFAFRCRIQDSDPPAVVRQKLEENIGSALGKEQDGQGKVHWIARLLGFETGESEHLHAAEGDAKSLHDRAQSYLGDYFRAVGTAGPLAILLEDLHWADDSSLDLLNHLLAEQPAFIVGTARPSFFERWPAWGEGPFFHTRIDLVPLDRDASRELVAEILSKVNPLPPALVDLVVNTAEGNPFYIEELIKMLIDDRVILTGGERWQVEEERLVGLRVPPTLKGVLQGRIDSLEPEQRSCLQRGAVIGRVFWDQAVQALAAAPDRQEGPDPGGAQEILGRLAGREMIYRLENSSFENTTEYLFKHALLRDVAYSSLLKRKRRGYHSLAARWLEERTGRTHRSVEFAMLIADHYDTAGETGQAATWYLQAGRAAADRFANSEALRALSRALELSPNPDPHWKFSVLLEREKVFGLLGRRSEQLADLEAMQAAAELSGDRFQAATALLQRAQYAFLTGDFPGAIERARQAEETAGQAQNQELAAQCLLLQAGSLIRQGALDLSGEHAQRALTLVAQQDLPRLQAEAYRHLGLVAYYLGNPHQAREHFAQALSLFEQAGDRPGEAISLNNLGGASFDIGDYEQAKSYYSRSLLLCQQIGDLLGQSRALNNLGIAAVTQGDYAQAEEYYLQALSICRRVGNRSGEMSALDNLGNLALYRYDYSLAIKYQREAVQGAREIGDRVGESFALTNLGRAYLLVGEIDIARESLQECLDLNRQLDDRQGTCHALICLAQSLAALGQFGPALASSKEALALARDGELRSAQGWALHWMADILLDLGRFGEAAGNFHQALDIRRELLETQETVETLAGLGRAALGVGDRQLAIECVEAVLTSLNDDGIEGFERPGKVFLNCCLVLRSLQDPRLAEVLGRGRSLLEEIASKIESESIRRSYLERVPENRALAEE